MNYRFQTWASFVLIITLVLVSLAFGIVSAQDQPQPARVRFGYFAFDPKDYDTLVDGEVFPFTTHLTNIGWSVPCYGIRCHTASPFFNFPDGSHSFTIVPKGKGAEERILGPITFTLEAGHAYSLAIVGSIADNNLDMLIIDEMNIMFGANPRSGFVDIVVNNIRGLSAVELKVGADPDVIPYGRFSSQLVTSSQPLQFIVSTASDTPRKTLFVTGLVSVPSGVSDLSGLYGSPGVYNQDYFFASNWGYPGQLTVADGGGLKVDTEIEDEIVEISHRRRYTLTLATDTVVNIRASGTDQCYDDSILLGTVVFNPALYVFDGAGKLLVWNDDESYAASNAGNVEAKLTGLALKAGTYQIEVGGSFDLISGPFKLAVERYTGM